jgi:hypothetical protein
MRYVLLLTLSLICARAADTQFGYDIVAESTPDTTTIVWEGLQPKTKELWDGLKTLQFTASTSAPTTGTRELAVLIRMPSNGSVDPHRHNPHDDPTLFATGVPEATGWTAASFMAAIALFKMHRRNA